MARQVFCDEKSRDMDSSSIGIWYSDISSNNNPTIHQTHHFVNQVQSFVSDPTEIIFNTNMDMIGFSKNHIHQQSFFNKLGQQQQQQQGASSCNTFYHHHHEYDNKKPCFTSGNICETTILNAHDSASASLLVDDDFSLRYVFPYEGNNSNNNNHNNTQSQGLSLSLSSNNIGLQSFELRNQQQHQPDFASSSSSRDGFYAKSSQQQMLQEGVNIYEGHFMVKNSKFLAPAQELLNEFCSLETKENGIVKHKKSDQKNKESWKEDSGKNKHSLTSLEFLELHKRKTKLLSMLEEVDRRYKHYRKQMKSVVSSFEAVAGNGGATVYSAMALEAMSKHFRCLKDGILDQINETKKAMGEKEEEECNKRKGSETPRLRMIEQKLRQQRELQQMNMMETHPWRPQRGLPQKSVSFLRAWLFQHFLHPYPNDVDKHILARQTGLSRSQVSNWFINARVRLWKPMVEEIYLEETKVQEEKNIECSEVGTNNDEDQKPNKPRLLRIDSKCVSSIINNPNHHKKDNPKNNCMNQHHEQCFGSLEIDFSSYTHHYDHNSNQSFNSGNGNGVSLTLGLQQHGESEVSLAFHQATQRSSMFYTRDQIDEVEFEPIHYSIWDGETQSNMPCRNLIGTQLLHDLVG